MSGQPTTIYWKKSWTYYPPSTWTGPIAFIFTGTHASYKYWIGRFPNTVFGVSAATSSNHKCQEFGRLADLYRLAVESDAPYMRDSNPFMLTRQAAWLADLRGIPTRVVLLLAANNILNFFGQSV
jgi:Tat protein secretion system quality control protein TatD with DNase activity